MASRTTATITTTTVRHIAKPLGESQENGPHLLDLREFVAACEGLPGNAFVRVTPGTLGESGRRDVTLEVTVKEAQDG